jgi:hypothetical protein
LNEKTYIISLRWHLALQVLELAHGTKGASTSPQQVTNNNVMRAMMNHSK